MKTAYAAFRDGADEFVTMWTVDRDVMDRPLTEQWNKVFEGSWLDMDRNGLLQGMPAGRDLLRMISSGGIHAVVVP